MAISPFDPPSINSSISFYSHLVPRAQVQESTVQVGPGVEERFLLPPHHLLALAPPAPLLALAPPPPLSALEERLLPLPPLPAIAPPPLLPAISHLSLAGLHPNNLNFADHFSRSGLDIDAVSAVNKAGWTRSPQTWRDQTSGTGQHWTTLDNTGQLTTVWAETISS